MMRPESIFEGISALLYGVVQCAKSPKIVSTYKRFGHHFCLAILAGYFLLSASMISFFPILLIVLAGPLLGTLLLFLITAVSSTVLFILFIIGRFPSYLFVGSMGILRPFTSLPTLSFYVATILVPFSMDEFVLEGIDACYPEIGTEKIRSSYQAPGNLRGIKLTLFNIGQGIFFVVLSKMMALFLGSKYMVYIDPVLLSIQIGSQLASTYTLRIRRMGVREHISWCGDNALRIVGFTLPFIFLQRWQWISTFVFLGLAPACTAALVKSLVFSDSYEREKPSDGDGLYKAKIH